MLRFTLWGKAARLGLGLAGAVLMAAMIAALSAPDARAGAAPYTMAVLGQLLTYLRLNLGVSAVTGVSVFAEIARTLPWTLLLATAGIVIAGSGAVGTPLGVMFGTGRVRRAAAPLIQILAAAPVFCAGLALAYVAQRFFHWPVAMADGSGVTLAALRADPQTASRALRVALLPALTVGMAGAQACSWRCAARWQRPTGNLIAPACVAWASARSRSTASTSRPTCWPACWRASAS